MTTPFRYELTKIRAMRLCTALLEFNCSLREEMNPFEVFESSQHTEIDPETKNISVTIITLIKQLAEKSI